MNKFVPKPTTRELFYNTFLFDCGISAVDRWPTPGPVIMEPVLDEGIQNWRTGSRFWSPQGETKISPNQSKFKRGEEQ